MKRPNMRRYCTAAIIGVLITAQLALAASDKELTRLKGNVGIRPAAGAVVHPLAGSQIVPDDSFAVTESRSAAELAMPDSSIITLGESTEVQVGKFTNTAGVPGSVIRINNGAMKFAIKHPSGGKANYSFVTPTSTIGVRGTEGFLVVGNQGTQLVCVVCAAGDVNVSITATGVVTSVVTGQVLTITGSPAAATTAVTTTSNLNTPAVNQFSNGTNPFGNSASLSNPTGATSGASTTAGVAPAAAAPAAATSAVSVPVAAGVTGATVAGVALNNQNTETAPAMLTFSPSSLSFSGPGQTLTFSAAPDTGPMTAVSANPNVATVLGSGPFTVHSVGVGTTTIMVSSSGGPSGSITVTVASTIVQPQRHP